MVQVKYVHFLYVSIACLTKRVILDAVINYQFTFTQFTQAYSRKYLLLYLPLRRGGEMLVYLCPLNLSAQFVHANHFCPSVLRVTVLPKCCMCSFVNQVYTSFRLASLRSLLPVTALPKDGDMHTCEISRYYHFALCTTLNVHALPPA